MATYEVSYTTTEKPENLPAGAKVERLSSLPAKVEGVGGTIKVRKRPRFNGKPMAAEVAFAAQPRPADRAPRTVGLSEEHARELGEALIAAADEAKAEREKGATGRLAVLLTDHSSPHRAPKPPFDTNLTRRGW